MSRENVEVVRQAIAAWNAGDMDRLRELYDPDAIARSPAWWPERGALVGRDAIIEGWSEMPDTWDIDSMRLRSDFLTAGDRVVVRVDWRGTGRGLETNMEAAGVGDVAGERGGRAGRTVPWSSRT